MKRTPQSREECTVKEVRVSEMNPANLVQSFFVLFSAWFFVIGTCTSYSAVLDPDSKYHLTWDVADTDITLEVQVETLGYVGLGFSPNGGMPGSDIVLVWVDDLTGRANISDRHSTAREEPVEDTVQDYRLISGSQNETHTTVKFERNISICSLEDNEITADTLRIIWSYHEKDPDADGHAMYHGINRGSKSIFLLRTDRPDQPMPKVITTLDMVSDRVRLPPRDTLYSCRSFRMPEFSTKHHMIAAEPVIQPGHEMNVHHIMIKACFHNVSESSIDVQHECYSRGQPLDFWRCDLLLVGWAIGAGKMVLPEHTGFPFGLEDDPTLLLLEIHYDNPQLRSDMVDSSGLRLIFTPELRRYDAGILVHGTTSSPSQIIPPYEENFQTDTHCVPECLEGGMAAGNVDDIKVIASILHTHLIGKAVRVRHFRHGVELEPIVADMNYDFNLQEFRLLDREVTIRPGDHTMTECVYDSRQRTNVTLGGLKTTDEMCLAFLVYYPKIPLSACLSIPRPSYLAKYGGVTVTDNWIVTAPPEMANKNLISSLNTLVDWKNETIRKGFQSLVKMREPYSYIGVCKHGDRQYSSHLRPLVFPDILSRVPQGTLSACYINAAPRTHLGHILPFVVFVTFILSKSV